MWASKISTSAHLPALTTVRNTAGKQSYCSGGEKKQHTRIYYRKPALCFTKTVAVTIRDHWVALLATFNSVFLGETSFTHFQQQEDVQRTSSVTFNSWNAHLAHLLL